MAKIIILGSAYPLRAGGLSTFNERLAEEFMAQGHEVIVYTFSLQYPRFLFPGKTQYAIRPAPKNLNIKVKVNSINPINWWLTGRQIRRENADLLVIRYWLPFMAPCLGTIAGIVRKNKKTRVVTIADNIIPHEKRPGDKLLTSWYVKKSDGFVTLSKSVLKQLEYFEKKGKPKMYSPHPLYDNFGEKISRDEALKALKLSPEYRYILFFGFIRDYKGLDILLEAMGHSLLSDLPVKLIVAGEFYSSDQPYYKILREQGLGNKVILHTQFIPNDKVAQYFCASDLVVQPYKDASQSGVTQVAYHFDIPMIVSNVGALPEMVPNNVAGLVVKPEPEKVARAIHRFFDKNMAEELKKGVQSQKDRFSWSRLTQAVFDVSGNHEKN
ncbi:MAG: glycosyltransferase [Bacteroidetes bacterium]|nr:MAG: glycosyltransferase [Bacteroidota bacterium]